MDIVIPDTSIFLIIGFSFILHFVVSRSGKTIAKMLGYSKIHSSLPPKEVIQWDSRMTSLVHCLLVVPLCYHALRTTEVDPADVWAHAKEAEIPVAISVGYFLYDLTETLGHPSLWGIGMIIHCFACLVSYAFVLFKRFLMIQGPTFLMWEISTIFLNIRGFLAAAKMENTTIYTVNGIVLISSFFIVRICYGLYKSVYVWTALLGAHNAPLYLRLHFMAANIILNSLNAYWFYLMITKAITLLFSKKKQAVRTTRKNK